MFIKDFLNITDVGFKMIIINIIKTQTTQILNMFKPVFDGVNLAMSLYNFKQSVIDSAMIPVEMVKMAAKTLATRGIENSIEIPNWILMKLAFELIDIVEMIPYPVVGAMGAFGFTDLIRAFHPIMPMDDLPPWERLTLDNLLFVLFLDDFCHNGKMYGGFQENFLP